MNPDDIWQQFRPYTKVKYHRYLSSLRLAEHIHNIPGDVVECGVWRGGMIAGIAETLGPKRTYWLFDSFEGLPPAEEVDGYSADGRSAVDWQNDPNCHNCTAHEKHAEEAMQLSAATDYKLVKGWFEDTLTGIDFPDGIALLRLDADWYSSTTQALEALFPKVNKDGIIIIDDYFYWDGAAKALHDYLSRHARTERIEQDGNWRKPGRPVCFLRARGWT